MNRRSFTVAVFFAAAFAGRAADTYPIAGTVINGADRSPIPHARVYLLRNTNLIANLTTGDDGKFRFDFPEGQYFLYAGPRTLPQVYGLQNPDASVGSAVFTGPGKDTSHLIARWFPRCVIAGKIVDENGEPVESALVQLLRSRVVGGVKKVTSTGFVRTNDVGEYRFASLQAGTYFLAVTAEPWYAKVNPAAAANQDGKSQVAFAPIAYPNTSDLSRAAPLILKPGEEAHADFNLSSIPGATVSVTHNAPRDFRGTIGLTSEGVGGTEAFERQESFSGALPSYNISGVPPGHYLLKITASPGQTPLEGQLPVDVNGSNLTVDVPLNPQPAVSGLVQLLDPTVRPKGTLMVGLVEDEKNISHTAAVKPDGSFSFPGLPAGRYRASVGLAVVGGYFASEIHVEGAAYRDGVLDLLDGHDVTMRLTASTELGHVRGVVLEDDKPVEGVMVVLAYASETHDAALYNGFLTDSDGSFDWASVRPGDYFLFATKEAQLEYRNRAALAPYLINAKRIRVDPHGVYSEKLVALPAPN